MDCSNEAQRVVSLNILGVPLHGVAGPMQALDAPVMGISSQQAAAILNDYGFLARQVLNKAGDRLASGAQHDVLMNLQDISQRSRFIVPRCGNSARFFRWNDMVYFESKPAKWPPVDAWDEYHRVARIQHGAVEEVCDFKFTSQVSLSP